GAEGEHGLLKGLGPLRPADAGAKSVHEAHAGEEDGGAGGDFEGPDPGIAVHAFEGGAVLAEKTPAPNGGPRVVVEKREAEEGGEEVEEGVVAGAGDDGLEADGGA